MKRKGAFWEDRHHATASDSDNHLVRCLVYIDLNMVRAGVVQHPSEWSYGGYNEILNPPVRYRQLARNRLIDLMAIEEKSLGMEYSGWIEEAVRTETCRQPQWSESVAVGGKKYVEKIKEELGCRAVGREIQERLQAGMSILGEPDSCYSADFGIKKSNLSEENGLSSKIFLE